jgi:hypothetical protein
LDGPLICFFFFFFIFSACPAAWQVGLDAVPGMVKSIYFFFFFHQFLIYPGRRLHLGTIWFATIGSQNLVASIDCCMHNQALYLDGKPS